MPEKSDFKQDLLQCPTAVDLATLAALCHGHCMVTQAVQGIFKNVTLHSSVEMNQIPSHKDTSHFRTNL